MIVSGLGCHLFSVSEAVVRGISTVVEPRNSHQVKKLDIVVPLKQFDEDMGLCSFQAELGAEINVMKVSSTTPAMVLAS